MDVAIIDYQMSNLHSVQAACSRVGLTSVITSDPQQILTAKLAILPGVGAFGEAMQHLSKSGLNDCITRFVDTGKPFVGICLGLQLLFEESQEFGSHKGLGLIKGTVKKFSYREEKRIRYPVPQVGWNRIQQCRPWQDSLLKNNVDGEYMYFVHSYYVEPEDHSVIMASTVYGSQKYCSAIQNRNIYAVQFHPEKSGKAGIKIYSNLKDLIRE